jgi:hypothetical protein
MTICGGLAGDGVRQFAMHQNVPGFARDFDARAVPESGFSKNFQKKQTCAVTCAAIWHMRCCIFAP